MRLIQCVPNFSEGRDKAKVEAIVTAIRQAVGVVVLDIEMDKDHNRCVITYVGSPEAVAEGAFLGAKKAMELIDMRTHKGEHPRMGATDVIPFTPLFGVSIAECVALSKKLAEKLAKELQIPVYLYGFSAAKPERENLANIRKGEYEVLAQVLGKDQSRDPDFGPAKIHPTAGATAVGAREQIINFNVNLNTSDMNLAKDIARRIRTSGGGLPHLRAKEIELGGQGKVQVSTVLGNYKVTGLKTVCENIEKIAGSAGVSITESELVGVVPSRALEECAMSQLRVKGFDPDKQILEIKLLELFLSRLEGRADSGAGISWENGLNAFCDALAKPDPIPGGGSASAGAAAMGIALMQKVFSLQIKRNVKEGKPAVEQQRLESLMTKLCGWSRRFRELAQEDALSFEAVTKAYKIPKTDPSRSASIQGAFKKACDVPLETLSLAVEAVNALSPEKNSVHPSVASDFKVGIYCLVAAQMGAKENVLINLDSIKDENYKAQMTAKLKTLEGTVRVAEKV